MNSSLSTPTLCIRNFKWDDLERLTALMRELNYPTTLAVMKERMEEMESSPLHCTLIAEVNDKVVGEISLRNVVSYANAEPSTQITSIVVDKDYHGQGIGKRLVRNAEEWSKSNGSKLLFLKSGNRVERAPARSFYKHIGFTNVGYLFSKSL
ncbi:GNAT family N-acetyltransferase [Paenibacillus crassostreae]|nr:GNAT family N-acetyltransferase [Paenibacillus crassostreae]